MKKTVVKYVLITIGICFVIGTAIAIYVFNKPQRNVADEKPAYIVTATEIYNDFTSNEALANQKYLSDKSGKIIQISGSVSEIIAHADTVLTIGIRDDEMMEGAILCSIDKSEIAKAAKFNMGDKVVLKGVCTGYLDLTGEVTFSKCVVIE